MSDQRDQRELDEALALLHQRARTAEPSLDGLRERVFAEVNGEVVPIGSRRRWLLPVAAAAVVVAGVTAVQVVRDEPEAVRPAAPPAVSLLQKAADLNVDGAPQPDGGYLHVVRRGTVPVTVVHGTIADDDVVDSPPNSGYTSLHDRRVESWVPFEPERYWRELRVFEGPKQLVGGAPPSTPAKPAAPWLDTGQWTARCGDYFPDEKPKTVCGGPDDPASPTFFATVPTEPAEIVAWLRDRAVPRWAPERGAPGPGAVFAEGVELLASGVLPKERYAGWYRALAMIDGVRDHGDVTMPDGRVGAAIGVPGGRERRELVIDRGTGRFLGERRVAGEHPAQAWIPADTVLGLLSVTSTRVPELGDR